MKKISRISLVVLLAFQLLFPAWTFAADTRTFINLLADPVNTRREVNGAEGECIASLMQDVLVEIQGGNGKLTTGYLRKGTGIVVGPEGSWVLACGNPVRAVSGTLPLGEKRCVPQCPQCPPVAVVVASSEPPTPTPVEKRAVELVMQPVQPVTPVVKKTPVWPFVVGGGLLLLLLAGLAGGGSGGGGGDDGGPAPLPPNGPAPFSSNGRAVTIFGW